MNPVDYYDYYGSRLDQYVNDVTNRVKTVGRLERLAVDRWTNIYSKKYFFDENEFRKKIKFCSLLNVKTKGRVSQLQLTDWQVLTFAHLSLYQFDPNTNQRSEKKVIDQVSISFAGKNGKSLTSVVIAIIALLIEDRVGLNVPIICPTQKQANQLLDYCKSIIKGSPKISGMLKSLHSTIVYTDSKTVNKIIITTNDPDKINGLEIGLAIIDEYYLSDLDSSTVLDIAKSKTQTSFNPLIFVIGTFSDKQRPTYQNYYLPNVNILEGTVSNDSHFILYCAQDDIEKEKHDSSSWIKSNPSLGVVKDLDVLIKKYEETKIYPASLQTFLTETLNAWSEAIPEELFLSSEIVSTLFIPDDIPLGSKVIIGCDFSTNRDMVGLNIMSESNGIFLNKSISIMPNVEKNFVKNDVDLRKWFVKDLHKFKENNYMPDMEFNENGYVIPSLLDYMDEALIYDIILDLSNKYKIIDVCYDQYNSISIISKIESKKINCTVVGQGIMVQNMPIKLMERLIYAKKFKIVNNALVKWEALSNLIVKKGLNGNVKFDKKKTKDGYASIDAWSSILNCMVRWCELNEQIIVTSHKEVLTANS
jgi:phage terminase large subunit-like protein